MSKINLFELSSLEDGTRRYQSQLMLGRQAADFIIKNDNKIYVWKSNQFVPYKGKYNIVKHVSEMKTQQL